MASPEVYKGGAERTAEIEKAAAERAAEIRERGLEQAGEHNEQQAEKAAERALEDAEKEAKSVEEYASPAAEKETAAPTTITARNPDKAFKQTMESVQREMSAPARTFSKVIHNKTIEKASDITGSTIARPNAILSGAICAFLLVLALYLHARYFGYALQGSETIIAFAIGWIIGIAFDFVRTIVRGKR